MLLSEIFLLTLVSLGVALSPCYLFLRSRMTRINKPHPYSRKTIFRVVGMHFSMMFVVTAIQAIILQTLLNGTSSPSQKAIFTISLQVLFLAAALYGSGIYITAILFETFVSKQYLVIRFLHGPLSHTIIYLSYLGAFGNLAFISNALLIKTSLISSPLFFLVGILGGLVTAIDNLANGILTFSVALTYSAFGVFLLLNPSINTFSVFFEGLLTGFLVLGTIILVLRFLKNGKLSWYEPVNVFKLRF